MKTMPNTKRGFGSAGLILVILIILGGGAYLWSQKSVPNNVPADNSFKTLPTPTTDTSAWKTYKNDKYGLGFEYPSTYEMRDFSSIDFESSPNLSTVLLTVYDPAGIVELNGESRKFSKALSVSITKQSSFRDSNITPNNLNLNQYVDSLFCCATTAWGEPSWYKDYKITRNKVSFGKEDGLHVIGEKTDGKRFDLWVSLHNGLFFEISYLPPDHLVFPKILSTFRFTK